MINKKGFTLIELLATVAIMLLIVTIAVPSITGLLNKNNKKVNNAQEEELLSLAELYMSAHTIKLQDGDEYLLSIQNMKDIDLLSRVVKLDENEYDYERDGVKIYKEFGSIKYAFVKNYVCDTSIYINGCSIFNAEETEVVYDNLTIPSTGSGGSDGTDFNYMYEDFQSDPNVSKPRLDYLDTATNYLIPVIYDETCDGGYGCWRKANTNKTWYDYSKGAWANVIRVSESKSLCDLKGEGCYDTIKKQRGQSYLSAPEGTEISEDDIQEMLVWIPKFDYKIEGTYEEGVIPSEISIQFNSNINDYKEGNAKTEWYTHPAFKKEIITQNGDEINYELKDIAGFWVQKFEGGSGAPNIGQLISYTGSCEGSNQYLLGGGSSRYLLVSDEKMINNFEWAAIAYLSQSDYGRINRCDRIGGTYSVISSRKQSSCTTEYAWSITGAGTSQYSNGHLTTYNANFFGVSDRYSVMNYENFIKTSLIQQPASGKTYCESTTGTIYGIYDMVGGFPEYVFIAMADDDTDYNVSPTFSYRYDDRGGNRNYLSSSITSGTCVSKDAYEVCAENNYLCNSAYDYQYYMQTAETIKNYTDFKLNYTKYHSYPYRLGNEIRDEVDYKKGDGIYEIFHKRESFVNCEERKEDYGAGYSYNVLNTYSRVALKRGINNIFDYAVTDGFYEQAVTTRLTYSNIDN